MRGSPNTRLKVIDFKNLLSVASSEEISKNKTSNRKTIVQ